MNDKPLTVKEAATFLSVNSWQVRYYINQGQLKAYKMGNGRGKRGSGRQRGGKHWRIWQKDLLDFLQGSSNIKEDEE